MMHSAMTIAKARNVRARVDRNSKGFAAVLGRWLAQYGRRVMEAELDKRIKKADDFTDAELAKIIEAYGVRAYDEATGSAAKASWIVKPGYREAAERKIPKLQSFAHRWIAEHAEDIATEIAKETRDAIRSQVQRVIADALKEDPPPSYGAIARRLRGQWYGAEGELPYTISNERAAVIARTELGQLENKGIADGYAASGVKTVEWIAVTSDDRTGDREHNDMDGKRCELPYSLDRDGHHFVTPLGNKLRWPGDTAAPIEDTINCRCTLMAVEWFEEDDSDE